MSKKQTWTRRSSAGAKGFRPGAWHLMGSEGVAWCGLRVGLTPTTSVQAHHQPPGPVCRDCLRAERRTERAAAKEARARAKAMRGRRRRLSPSHAA